MNDILPPPDTKKRNREGFFLLPNPFSLPPSPSTKGGHANKILQKSGEGGGSEGGGLSHSHSVSWTFPPFVFYDGHGWSEHIFPRKRRETVEGGGATECVLLAAHTH